MKKVGASRNATRGTTSNAPQAAPRTSSPRQVRPTSSTPRGKAMKSSSPRVGAPLKASANALQPTTDSTRTNSSSSTSPDRQRSERRDRAALDQLASLQAEVSALREQLQLQAAQHQADLTALRTEQAFRTAALEDGLRAEAVEAERALCSHFAEEAATPTQPTPALLTQPLPPPQGNPTVGTIIDPSTRHVYLTTALPDLLFTASVLSSFTWHSFATSI